MSLLLPLQFVERQTVKLVSIIIL